MIFLCGSEGEIVTIVAVQYEKVYPLERLTRQ